MTRGGVIGCQGSADVPLNDCGSPSGPGDTACTLDERGEVSIGGRDECWDLRFWASASAFSPGKVNWTRARARPRAEPWWPMSPQHRPCPHEDSAVPAGLRPSEHTTSSSQVQTRVDTSPVYTDKPKDLAPKALCIKNCAFET